MQTSNESTDKTASDYYEYYDDYLNTYRTDQPCELINRNGECETIHCHEVYPFICKVEAKDAPFDSRGNVYATGKILTFLFTYATYLMIFICSEST